MRLPLALVIGALGLSAAMAPTALAGPIEDFRDDGQLNVCDYSREELQRESDRLPPDVIQYSPGLADQLSGGREGCGGTPESPDPRRTERDPADTDQDGDVDTADIAAAGAGGGGRGGANRDGQRDPAGPRVPDAPAPSAAARARLADISTPPVSARPGSDVPGWVVALLVALGLGALLFTLARFGGYSAQRLTGPLRASFADAGGRSSDALAEIWDSVRLGR